METMSRHQALDAWIADIAALARPDRVVWIEGTPEERERLIEDAVSWGEVERLNPDKFPGCLYHRSDPSDVARTEELTFICSSSKEDAGPTNHWMAPEEGYRRARAILKDSMRGRTMYVIPFSMGLPGSEFSKIGVQLTDSLYVVLNMLIMTRAGRAALDVLGSNGEFVRCVHGKIDLDIKKRLILHFPEDQAIWSTGSGYGGNALLGKKCLALRIASHAARREGWLAEHMLIVGIEDPSGRTEYITAAFPSACGKTNLAMLIPPEPLRRRGYKVWTVGDDIAWLRIGSDGRLWAVNPEFGFFGVAPGTNSKSNRNAIETIRRNTIYTNVALGRDGTVWWEGADWPLPPGTKDWLGVPYDPKSVGQNGAMGYAAHPNSRFTAPASQCPSLSPHWEDPQGVPISAILFGARRERLAPLVYESFDWKHGVYVGATMASERTAAQTGKVGELRYDPMAMIPFCGYNMADYFTHWLDMGRRIPKPPKIFHVNWFRKNEAGKFLWPGYGENLRVVNWILARTRGESKAQETPIGYVPTPEALDLDGVQVKPEDMEELLKVRPEEWEEEIESQHRFLSRFDARLSPEIWREHEALKERLRSAVAA
jgi:phosphoenolpyruvate carboxykinase (GTP)